MDDLRMCYMGHEIEPRGVFCSSGHAKGVCLRCPVKECSYQTKPVKSEFEDLVQREIDQHMLECHYEYKKMMRQVCYYGHTIKNNNVRCEAGHQFGVSLKCQFESCPFATKPVMFGFMDIANRRMSYHVSASHPSSYTRKTNQVEDGNQAEVDKAAIKFENEASKDEIETRGNYMMDDDPHAEDSCDEPMENEAGSKSVSSYEKKSTCPLCFKIFYSKGNMKAHIKLHHDDREKRFECVVCKRSFSARISLEYHVRKVHSYGDEVSCDRCEDKFEDFGSYAIHRKTHRSIHFQLEHKCEECDKIIRGKNNLQRHMKEVHKIVKTRDLEKVTVKIFPHKCDACSEVFKRKNDLVNHVEGKHRGKRFSCNFCDKSFPYKRNVTRHIKNIHKGLS